MKSDKSTAERESRQLVMRDLSVKSRFAKVGQIRRWVVCEHGGFPVLTWEDGATETLAQHFASTNELEEACMEMVLRAVAKNPAKFTAKHFVFDYALVKYRDSDSSYVVRRRLFGVTFAI